MAQRLVYRVVEEIAPVGVFAAYDERMEEAQRAKRQLSRIHQQRNHSRTG